MQQGNLPPSLPPFPEPNISCAKHLTIEFYTVVMLLTFVLIIISIPSLPHSFIRGLKPSFSANPSRRGLPFLLQD